MSRILIAVGLALACLSPAQGARDLEFNVDFLCGWDGYYRPMEWTPVEIGIASNAKEPFSGSFTMTARQDGINTLNVTHPFVLTPDRPLSLPLATKFAFAADQCSLTIRDEKGRTRWRQVINTWDFSTQNRLLRVIQEQDFLVGLVGQAQFGLLRLPQETTGAADRPDRVPGKVYVGSKVARSMPWDWTGYVSLDLLVICDLDWSLLQPQQSKAIGEWIANGGTVLLIVGQHPLPPESPLAVVLPFQFEGPKETQIPPEVLREWGLDASRTQTVTAWTLSPKPKAALEKATETGGLYGIARVGFGRVAALGFNPAQLNETQAAHSAAFWVRQISACCRSESAAVSGPPTMGGRRIVLAGQTPPGGPRRGFNPPDNYYRISVSQNASNRVMEYLYQLEQMRPLSIWWIVLTLMTLAVLLGPVDYLVLKRLDKLPYTWLTSTGWIVIFTVGAYFGVQWLRAGAMEVRAVSVLDGIADSNCAWATCYAGLFAPRSGDYRLAGLAPHQWWSGIAPTREEMWSYQRDTGMQQIHCVQVDGGNLPVSLPINMWTVQPLLSEWALDRMPFTATVERRQGETTVEIKNTSDSAIQRGYVLFAETSADVGPVPPHTTKRFDVRTHPFRPWQNGDMVVGGGNRRPPMRVQSGGEVPRYPGELGGPAESAFLAQGCLSRTLAMHQYLDSGAALVCVIFDQAPLPINVKDRTYAVNHIQLARQLVLPKK